MASQHQQKIASFIPRDGDKNLFEKRDLVFIKIYKNFQANTWKQHLTLIHYLSIIAHRRYFHSPLYLFPRFYLRDLKRALFLHFAFVSPLSGTSVGLRTIERNVVSETGIFPSSSEYRSLETGIHSCSSVVASDNSWPKRQQLRAPSFLSLFSTILRFERTRTYTHADGA